MRRIISGAFLLIVLWTSVSVAAAHGGGDLIARSVQAGPYEASVWVNPPNPRANEAIHFTVGLASPEDGSPVLDANIQVVMRLPGREEAIASAPATTDQSVNKLFYETDVEVPAEGNYQVDFHISGSDGQGTITLDMEVKPKSSMNWLAIGLAGLGVVLVWGWWRSRSRRLEEAIS